ncbi:MAG: hypothetical protein RML15_06510 [Bacteroidota bacterium]|nr:hypothetical protein [Candidatus Kapabacteria bacterium]MCS7303446.1 hypothetical protein [Candidatus Kapabacteria bacterium]MCX7937774.1 hypothetical protein [Chlorobiota bacterium]MDW8075062.1 hypothetical protein [Bacteroidota bacterium]MDW8272044.1 hypothetical protein [Bacteroidota bacterium]
MKEQTHPVHQLIQPAVQHKTEESFEDMLDVPLIPATQRGVPKGGYLPAEYVAAAPTPATIIHTDGKTDTPMSVVLEKDATGVVRTIVIYCACGNSTVIALEYGDEAEIAVSPSSMGSSPPQVYQQTEDH